MDADTIIVAIGQVSDTALMEKIGVNPQKIDPVTLQSSDEMIFLAGDVISGPTSVVEAMARGRQAADNSAENGPAQRIQVVGQDGVS